MPARKMRVELFDGEGNRYVVSFEGQITRDKAVRLMDLVELLGGAPSGGGSPSMNVRGANEGEFSKYEKMRLLVHRNFPVSWFSSREVQSAYEQEFKQPVSLSTIATYLSRMVSRGGLLRMGASNKLKYRVAPSLPPAELKQRIT
ncbi:MAG TPA: hypothetical protein VIH48_04375 [Candidatus Bathyarchaeia archaeon]